MFYTIEELVQQADRDYQGNIAELMIATETELTGRERHEILALMTRNLEVMKESVQAGLSPEKSPTGLTGGDAAKLDAYIKKEIPWLILLFWVLLEMPWLLMNLMPRWDWFVPHQLLDLLAAYLLFLQLLSKNWA